MYWPSDTLVVSNVAHGDKRFAHPCPIAFIIHVMVAVSSVSAIIQPGNCAFNEIWRKKCEAECNKI